jgi:HK97 gp10 family phage protein
MAEAVEFRLEGAEELIKYLESLGSRASLALLAATMAGGQVIADEANRDRNHAVVVAPELDKKSKNQVTVAIGPHKDHWYEQFFETGAAPHEITPDVQEALELVGGQLRKRVEHPGMAADPFLRPALDAKGEEACQEVGAYLFRAMEK